MTALLAVSAVILVLCGVRVRLALSWRHGAALAAVLATAVARGAGGTSVVPLVAAAVVVAVVAAAGAVALVLVLSRRTVPACLRGGGS